MPSVRNPNGPSKNRLIAKKAALRKLRQKESAQGKMEKIHKITRDDQNRGARPGLLPNSGPKKALGKKAQRKLEKKMGYAIRRKMEKEGLSKMEVEKVEEMMGIGKTSKKSAETKAEETPATKEVEMDFS
ncbi:hypothetical protein SMACR_03911 [Sordaria macrospora]|uniref:WGS project CABT00000000 data, contig 2.17 n=2 Tax=Sordaria macrospora TaxID=5147 RepID=F7W0A5_SORMK|nr:uncharacterized protein SMAC_03911 [Sordaria macrospora k-hell]KAA8634958.1 hypothetical protein SMACR_03911 [Sordaria macrospora]KAH7633241.1 hypothetical protein B0T09DRAFT_88394 [Sordaria sp. MPI-SDFR-AT-0083]WPJ60351.1 hypothetical protein SMAC4_03911 [Sordaria macrospora]CCC11205.1 unnamed protein product [Sordaria macrospora k-hell]